jgi:hypothetical protein
MSRECVQCQDPLYDFMPRCTTCGQANGEFLDSARDLDGGALWMWAAAEGAILALLFLSAR